MSSMGWHGMGMFIRTSPTWGWILHYFVVLTLNPEKVLDSLELADLELICPNRGCKMLGYAFLDPSGCLKKTRNIRDQLPVKQPTMCDVQQQLYFRYLFVASRFLILPCFMRVCLPVRGNAGPICLKKEYRHEVPRCSRLPRLPRLSCRRVRLATRWEREMDMSSCWNHWLIEFSWVSEL